MSNRLTSALFIYRRAVSAVGCELQVAPLSITHSIPFLLKWDDNNFSGFVIMSVALKFQALVRRPVVNSPTIAAATGLRRTAPWRQSYSSAVGDTLPLTGIKVLDMTRVLAGVSILFIFNFV